jgi:hypothetical protein
VLAPATVLLPPKPPPVEVVLENTESEPFVFTAPPAPTVTVYGIAVNDCDVAVLNPPAPPPPK